MLTAASRAFKPALTLALSAALVGAGAIPALPAAADSAVPRGELLPALRVSDRVGDLDAAQTVEVQLALKLRNQDELAGLLDHMSSPGSPGYGHYLAPAEFAARFGPTGQQVGQAGDFLRAAGLEVTSVTAPGTLINARGSVANVERALHTRLGRYVEHATGRQFFANDTVPSVPAAIAAGVLGVHGLDNRTTRRPATAATRRPAAPGGGPAGGYTPAEIRGAYNLAADPLAGKTGAGQAIGLLELDGFRQADIDSFDTQYYGAPLAAPTVVSIDGAATAYQLNPGAGQIETELDIEVTHGVAPDVTVRVYEAPNTNPGVNNGYSAMVTDGTLGVGSTSWGLCETAQGLAETNTLDQIFQQAAAQGVSFYAASGDYGAYDCRPANDNLVADSPASDPYVVGVGGTALTLTGSSYVSETAWSNTAPDPDLGTGGGLSRYFTRPSYQAGSGVNNQYSNGMRQVPDVALDGDPRTGYSVYTCGPGGGCALGGWTVVAGTSAGGPGWASLTAIYNQYAAGLSKPRLGWPHAQLYNAAACPGNLAPFHDVTTGNNLFHPATAGWDFATGLGTPRASDLAQALSGVAAPGLQVNSVSPNAGQAGDRAVINGCGFTTAGGQTPAVSFGGVASPGVGFDSSQQLRAVVPKHTYGAVNVTVTNPGGGAAATRLSAFTYVPSGYTLDGYGGVHRYGTSPLAADNTHAYWGWNIARGLAVCPEDNRHGYTFDGYGGVHPFGLPALPPIADSSHDYWGWDIGRGIVLTSCSPTVAGYTLDGWGHVHGFGSAGNPANPGVTAYWPGWDIARALAACPDMPGSGYTLDGYGGVHAWGPGLPNIDDGSHAYWGGWDIARALVLTRCQGGLVGGYTLDGYGGVHRFGNSPPPGVVDSSHDYWSGWDIARGITVLDGGSGGYVLDGWGGMHPFRATVTPPAVSVSGYWPGWDIARSVGSSS